MTLFLAGIALFFIPHVFTAFWRDARSRFVNKLGAGPYKGLYSLLSAAGLVMIVVGWGGADARSLFVSPLWLRYVTQLLMLLALIALASAYLPKGRVAPALKHPMLAGVKLWAFAHLLVNGEVRSLVLFGAFLAYAVADRIAVKRRGEPTPAAGPWRNDIYPVAAGGAAWALIYYWLHPYIGGVALH
jgi:uncharacterized membrane protein